MIFQKKISTINNGEGVLTLEYEDEFDLTRSLQVRFDNKKYVMHYGFDNGVEWVVQTINNKEDKFKNNLENIAGDFWRSSTVFEDSSIVEAAFFDFFKNGFLPECWINQNS